MSVAAYIDDSNPPTLTCNRSNEWSSECRLEYLNEGGANIVFRILAPLGQQQNSLPSSVRGKLLRLRKDLPHLQTTVKQHRAYEKNISHLFPPEHLVEHSLVNLTPELITLLSQTLNDLARPSHRASDSLPSDERHGLLVTDMTPSQHDALLQLKPKWLAQSPSAPPNARRCRTCALRAHRASRQIRTATDAQESCPLDLVSADERDRMQAASAAAAGDGLLTKYLAHHAQHLLLTLRAYQVQCDTKGGVAVEEQDEDAVLSLCKAMTLRDCTLFLRRSGETVEARLGDLDLKQSAKLAKWKEIERSLISEGWYAGTAGDSTTEHICQLSRPPIP